MAEKTAKIFCVFVLLAVLFAAGSRATDYITRERVQDYVGEMVSGNIEYIVRVDYRDSAGKLDFRLDPSPMLGSLIVDNDVLAVSVPGYETMVGIGTTTPEATLDVDGDISIQDANGRSSRWNVIDYNEAYDTDLVTNLNADLWDGHDFEDVNIGDLNDSEELVEDYIGGMLGGTETLITVTYQDSTNDIDFVVDNDLHNYDWTNAAPDVGGLSDNLDDTDASVEWEDAADLESDGSLSTDSVADNEIDYTAVNMDDMTDGLTNAAVTLTQETNWDNHIVDNTQAHSDYLINNGDDTTTGKVMMADLELSQSGYQHYIFTDRYNDDCLAMQSQNSNTAAHAALFTKDGNGEDYVLWSIYGKGTVDSITNYEVCQFVWIPENFYAIRTLAGGTGTEIQPIRIYTGGNTTQLVLSTTGTISMGGRLTCPSLTMYIGDEYIIDTTPNGSGSATYCIGNETIDTSPIPSERKTKDNIVDTAFDSNDIKKIYIKDYNFKPEYGDPNINRTGIIAEDIEEQFPEAIKIVRHKIKDADDSDPNNIIPAEYEELKYVDKDELIPYMIKAIQDLQKEVEMLKARR